MIDHSELSPIASTTNCGNASQLARVARALMIVNVFIQRVIHQDEQELNTLQRVSEAI
ncbi:hypothetical protein [Bradyrhizobium sp. STM 3562]|uniref:hypothetical protein n=1 Tax=Bradyrhizobium sp. STM 3562 TaxID=578924 RepID=UPI00388DDFB3